MKGKPLRRICVVAISGLLAFFFIPVLYNATLFACGNGAVVCLTNPSGLESLGYRLLHQGLTYSFEPGTVDYGLATAGFGALTTFGVLVTYVFPSVVACVALLAPEITRVSKVTRAGFAAFGGFVAVFSLLCVSVWTLPLSVFGVLLFPTGAYMVPYGMRIWIFGTGLPREQQLPSSQAPD